MNNKRLNDHKRFVRMKNPDVVSVSLQVNTAVEESKLAIP